MIATFSCGWDCPQSDWHCPDKLQALYPSNADVGNQLISVAIAGGVQGVQVNPHFFKLIIFIACMFSMQIATAIQDTYLKFKFSLN